MKLPIKKKYFDLIKAGKKFTEYRDAHITFVCEETGETIRREIVASHITRKSEVPKEYDDVLEDSWVLVLSISKFGEVE